jgi:surface polysaccharide O-acyltransferase-like enzyme
MAHKFHLIDEMLHLASTSRAKSVVSAAAIAFAVCHLVVIGTAPASVMTGNADAELPRQIVYMAAVLARFAVPLCIMIVGLMLGRSKSRGSRREIQ